MKRKGKTRKNTYKRKQGLKFLLERRDPFDRLVPGAKTFESGYLVTTLNNIDEYGFPIEDNIHFSGRPFKCATEGNLTWVAYPLKEFNESLKYELTAIWRQAKREESLRYERRFARLWKQGVIRIDSYIRFLMKERDWTKRETISTLAETYGMKEQTQSVYLSDEFELRAKERERASQGRKEKRKENGN